MDEYSISGMAKCSLSRVIRLRLKVVVLSFLEFSKVILRWEASWSAYRVIVSSLLANFMTLDKFAMLTPRTMLVSALNVSNPSWDKFNETRATWELSIAWREMPNEQNDEEIRPNKR
jgi:hypothetical protein